jgi:hypothetical protein
MIAYYLLDDGDSALMVLQVGLMLSAFIGPFIIGWLCGWLAFDDRGVTYGILGALGSVIIFMIFLLASGGIAFLLSFAALAGGFNGGTLSNYRGKRR